MRALLTTLLLLGTLLIPAVAAHAEAAVFGDQGELYEVLEGRFGELFPGAAGADPEAPVLALRLTAPAGEQEVLLIPGTEGPETEHTPLAVFDSGQLFVLYATGDRNGASELNLLSFDGEGFGETIEVSGNPRRLKGKPRMSLTRDPYGESALAVTRTIVHLLWWEQGESTVEVFYTPVVLLDGVYLGWNPVVELDAFDLNPENAAPAPDSALFRAANLERGPDGRSLVVALPQQRSSRLLTLRTRVIPSTLVSVANDARTQIVGIGRKRGGGPRPLSILTVADAARTQIVGIGRMHQGVLDYIADEVYTTILSYGTSVDDETIGGVADLAWQTVLRAGASILGNGLRSEAQPCSFLYLGDQPGQIVGSAHQIEICLASDRPLPETAPDARHTIFASESGENVLVAWEEGDALHYVASADDEWSAPVSISLSGPVSAEQALTLLRQQVRVQ